METLIIFWMLCAIVGAVIASVRGGSAIVGFGLGLFLGPLGLVAAFFAGTEAMREEKQIAAQTKKLCPRCAELVQRAALVCKHCGHEFSSSDEAVTG